jgi:hypothetical protein
MHILLGFILRKVETIFDVIVVLLICQRLLTMSCGFHSRIVYIIIRERDDGTYDETLQDLYYSCLVSWMATS